MVEGLLKRHGRYSAFLIALSITFTGCISRTSARSEKPEEDKVIFYQLEPMREGEEIAVVTTTEGDIYLRFFPSEAPKAVSNFVTLAQEGFYDGKSVFSIQAEEGSSGTIRTAFLTGASNETGSRGKTIFHTLTFRSEISKNLWHFPGAVSAYGPAVGKVDSRFFIVGEQEVDDETIKQMKKAYFPDEVIDKFEEYGGAPSYSRLYPVFAQVYKGMDVVEKILDVECNEKGTPVQDIIITSIKISYYHLE